MRYITTRRVSEEHCEVLSADVADATRFDPSLTRFEISLFGGQSLTTRDATLRGADGA